MTAKAGAMVHVVLSPHPDDAVLSCGGIIYQFVQAEKPVTVRTIMSGAMPPDLTMSAFVEEHIVRWELGPDPIPARKVEDQCAVAVLAADVEFGSIPDALYRTDGEGTALYPDLDRLFGPIHPRDPALKAFDSITVGLDDATAVYVPLGAGRHVDHCLVRDAALAWLDSRSRQLPLAVFFYEEYPYSADGESVIQAALDAVQRPMNPVIYSLDAAALAAKINAIACHKSQITTFWDDVDSMAAAVRDYAMQVGQGGYAERLWRFA